MNKQKDYLSLVLAGTFFLKVGYSHLFSITSQDSWLAMIWGAIFGFFFLLLAQRIKVNDCFLFRVARILIHLFLFGFASFLFLNFLHTFVLPNTPQWFLALPLFYLIYQIAKEGYDTLNHLAKILIPIFLFSYLVILIGLFPLLRVEKVFPIATTPISQIFLSSFLFTFYSLMPYLLFDKNQLLKSNVPKNYLISSLFVILIGILSILVLGPNLLNLYPYPEFALLREIKIFDFMENLGNILSFVYLIPLFLTICFSFIRIKDDFSYIFTLFLHILY